MSNFHKHSPWLVLVLVMAVHIWVNHNRWQRFPAIDETFHSDTKSLAKHAIMLTEDVSADHFVVQLQPSNQGEIDRWQLLKMATKSPEPNMDIDGKPIGNVRFNSYRNSPPLWYLATSIPAVLFGVSQNSVLLSPLLILSLIAGLLISIGRDIDERGWGATFAAVLMTMIPIGWQGARIGSPILGNVLAVTLVLWALIKSDALRKPWWTLLAGVLVGYQTRWGESVGDGLLVSAAVVGPLLCCLGIALHRIWTRRRWMQLSWIAGAIGLVIWLTPWAWLLEHTNRYVLSEATGGQQSMEFTSIMRYPKVLTWSLLGAPAMAMVLVGVVGAIWLRSRWKMLLLLSSFAGLFTAITLSSKGNDYYAASAIPSIVLIGGLGTAAIPIVGRWLGVMLLAWISTGWWMLSQIDAKTVSNYACKEHISTWVIGDPYLCSSLLRREHPGWFRSDVYQWFRVWRQPLDQTKEFKARFSRWLLKQQGHQALSKLPSGALVLLLTDKKHPYAESAELFIITQRPDLFVHQTGSRKPNPGSLTQLLINNATEIAVLSFQEDPYQFGSPSPLPSWISAQEKLAYTLTEELWSVELRP